MKKLNPKRKTVFDVTTGRYRRVNDETEEERTNRHDQMRKKKSLRLSRTYNEKWNFRKEADIGGAMRYTIGKKIDEENRQTRKLRKQLKRNGDAGDRFKIDPDLSNDDMEEPVAQSQTQSQLDLMLKKVESSQTSATIYSDPKEDPSHPLHYLWRGRSAPKWSDMKHNYISLLQNMNVNTNEMLHTLSEKSGVLRLLITAVTRQPLAYKDREDNMTKFICNESGREYRNVVAIAPLLDMGHSSSERKICPETLAQCNSRSQFLRKKSEIGAHFDRIHEEAKKVQSTVARYFVGCASVSHHMPKENIELMLDVLHGCSSITDSTRTIIRQSQTLASNFIMWNEIAPTMKQLYSKGYLGFQEYDCIHEELLSSDSEFFTNPWLTTNEVDCSRSDIRRKCIYNFIHNLRKKHLENGKKRTHLERDELSSDDERSESGKEEADEAGDLSPLPWQPKYSEALAKNIIWNRIPHTEMAEKYSQVVYNAPTISVATIHLTLSFFFSLMARQKASSKSSGETSSNLQMIHQEIERFLSKLSSNIWTSNSITPFPCDRVLLSAPLAYVTLMTQSYIANSGMYGTNKKVKEEEGYVSSDNSDSGSILSDVTNEKMSNESTVDFNDIANILAAKGQLHLRDNKLGIFSQIHLTTGVSILAKCFNSRCAEMLGRPCFTGGIAQDSPFDLVRMALDEADKHGGIERNTSVISYGSHAIHMEELIREFDNAAEVFLDILTNAPTNLDCHCWYVAARIGSTLVASGISIGKGARVAMPHEYSMEDFDTNLCGDSFVRSRNIRYNELRATASEAVRTLLDLDKKPSAVGHRYHYAITSLLEWKEAIGLLALRPHLNKKSFQCIRELHAYHTILWAQEERTEASLKRVMLLSKSGLLSLNHVMCLLAKIIEKDPNNCVSWLALSSILPVEDEISLTKMRLKSYWWGSEVAPNWKAHFFATPLTFDPRKSPNYGNDIENLIAIKKHVTDAVKDPDSIGSNDDFSSQFSCFKHNVKFKSIRKDWLYPTRPSDEDEEDHLDVIDDDGNIRMFDQDLPSDCRESKIDFHLVIKLLEEGGDSEIVAAKALIALHLYGSCSYTRHAVYFLMRKGDCTDENCIELKLLTWLAKQNLDVTGSIDALISMLRRRNYTSRTPSQIDFKFACF